MERDIVKYWENSNRMNSTTVEESMKFEEQTKALRETYQSAVKACCYAHQALYDAVQTCKEEENKKYLNLKKQVRYSRTLVTMEDGFRKRLILVRTFVPEGFVPNSKDCPEKIKDSATFIVVGNLLYYTGSYGGHLLTNFNNEPVTLTNAQVESIHNEIFPIELIRCDAFGLTVE